MCVSKTELVDMIAKLKLQVLKNKNMNICYVTTLPTNVLLICHINRTLVNEQFSLKAMSKPKRMVKLNRMDDTRKTSSTIFKTTINISKLEKGREYSVDNIKLFNIGYGTRIILEFGENRIFVPTRITRRMSNDILLLKTVSTHQLKFRYDGKRNGDHLLDFYYTHKLMIPNRVSIFAEINLSC